MASALHTNAEPSWNSAISVISPSETASPYSAIEVSSRVVMSMSLNSGDWLVESPITAMRASSTASLASSIAAWATALGTVVVALSLRSFRMEPNLSSRPESAAASTGFIESYSSATGWVACVMARSLSPASRLSSSALKCPRVSSRAAPNSSCSSV